MHERQGRSAVEGSRVRVAEPIGWVYSSLRQCADAPKQGLKVDGILSRHCRAVMRAP